MNRTALSAWVRRFRDRASQQAQRRFLVALHDPGLALGETRLELVPHRSRFQLQVRHDLRQVGPLAGRGFVLDLAHCPFMLDNIRCSCPSRVYQHLAGLVVEPIGGADLHGASIEYVVDWDPTSSGSADRLPFLRFPDDLPTSLSELGHTEPATGFSIGPWAVLEDELIRDTVVAGVPVHPLGDEDAPGLLRGFIMSEESIAARPARAPTGILLTRAGANLFPSSNEGDDLTAVAEEAVEFLSSLFGWRASGAVLIAGPGDMRIGQRPFGGPVLHLDEHFAARYRPGSLGMRFEIVRELCSLYWGSGCRVLGGAAGEFTAAIGAAVALWWATTHTDHKYVEQTSRAFARVASRPRLLDYADTAVGNMSSRLVGRLTQKMFKNLLEEDYRNRLARVTSEVWGMYVPYSAVLRELEL